MVCRKIEFDRLEIGEAPIRDHRVVLSGRGLRELDDRQAEASVWLESDPGCEGWYEVGGTFYSDLIPIKIDSTRKLKSDTVFCVDFWFTDEQTAVMFQLKFGSSAGSIQGCGSMAAVSLGNMILPVPFKVTLCADTERELELKTDMAMIWLGSADQACGFFRVDSGPRLKPSLRFGGNPLQARYQPAENLINESYFFLSDENTAIVLGLMFG